MEKGLETASIDHEVLSGISLVSGRRVEYRRRIIKIVWYTFFMDEYGFRSSGGCVQ